MNPCDDLPHWPSRETVIDQFWERLLAGRTGFPGTVGFYPERERDLIGWISRLREELARFLHEYEPDKQSFLLRCRRIPDEHLSDDALRCTLLWLVAADFGTHLEANGVPRDIAQRAQSVYTIDLVGE
jgi:hypothetical protein